MSAEEKAVREMQASVEEAQDALRQEQEQENQLRTQIEAERRDERDTTEQMMRSDTDVHSPQFTVLVRRRELARARTEVLLPRLAKARDVVAGAQRTLNRRVELAAGAARIAAEGPALRERMQTGWER